MSIVSELPADLSTLGEADPRFRIAAARRILHREGLDSQIGGHVSLRVPGEEAFYVTPYQYFDETLPEHVSKVSFDLHVLEPGTLGASPGINFHADVYRARPDVNCVIHAHSFWVSVLTTTGAPFGVYYDYAALLLDGVGTWKDDPSLTPDIEGPMIAATLGQQRALLMDHHGSINAADTLENAVMELLVLELCAHYQVEAMKVGGQPLDDATARTYREAYLKYGFRQQMWDANYRRLRKSDPDLFDVLN